VRLSSMAENCFNAVERIDEFSHLPTEGRGPPSPPTPSQQPSITRRITSAIGASKDLDRSDSVSTALLPPAQEHRLQIEVGLPPAQAPPPGFPQAGRIEFINAQMRYRPGLPLVLKGLSFTIDAGSKVRGSRSGEGRCPA
jgi:ABC-type multidrug transport system fused ATPase/permease subunit